MKRYDDDGPPAPITAEDVSEEHVMYLGEPGPSCSRCGADLHNGPCIVRRPLTAADVSEEHGVEMLSRVTFVVILAVGALTLLWFVLSALPDVPEVRWK